MCIWRTVGAVKGLMWKYHPNSIRGFYDHLNEYIYEICESLKLFYDLKYIKSLISDFSAVLDAV